MTVIEDDSKLHQPKDTMPSGDLNGLDVHYATVIEEDPKLQQPKDTMTFGGLKKVQVT